jgi:ABC-type sugar transport system ATPase subunit
VLLAADSLAWRDRVSGVSLAVRAGEILGLTGLLGAGQNEVARLLGGDLAPDRGTICVGDATRRFRHPADAIAAGICLVTDERKSEGILPNLALRENIALPSLASRTVAGLVVRPGAERKAVAEEWRSASTSPAARSPAAISRRR